MLNLAVRNTNKVIRERSREENVRLGRLFTKKTVARLMADMCPIPEKERVYVLDPGAGTGILSAAIVERLCQGKTVLKEIFLDVYETSEVFLPMLRNNMERIRKKARHDYGVKLICTVHAESFLLAAADSYRPSLFTTQRPSYDLVLAFPPDDLIEKDSTEGKIFADICTSDTPAVCLFLALASKLLAADGHIVAQVPTSLSYSIYLAKFRRQLLSECALERIHLFAKKAKSANGADLLRKTMLLHLRAGTPDETLRITTSYHESDAFDYAMDAQFVYDFIVRGEDRTLLLIKNAEEKEILDYIADQPETLASLGLKLKTGLTLESRYPDLLRSKYEEGTLPLISPACIQKGRVNFPLPNKANQFIIPRIPSLMQKNKNMLFIKRVPAKADGRRFICGIYLGSQFPKFKYISTHNKLNYLDYEDGREMDAAMLHGVYAVLTSMIYDRYCTILSTSAQINAKEYAELPLPSVDTLREIGSKLGAVRDLSPRNCDAIVHASLKAAKRTRND